MKLKQLNDTCYYFDAIVNIGYVHHGEQGMLIDAGIDDSVMRKVLRQLSENDLPITHLFITHAHADHFGGADFLQQKQDVYTFAPVLEAAIMKNPILEPLYLFGGNDPLPELQNKFLQGKPIEINRTIDEGEHEIDSFSFITHFLPGHSYHQLGMQIDGILYAGDSYFGEEQLHKHKIPYITEADLTIQSLNRLLQIPCEGAVPGHGTYETDFHATVTANIAYHEQLLSWVFEKVGSQPNGISHEAIVSAMCEHYDVASPSLSQWLLYRTAVTGYLAGLIKRGKIEHGIESNKWVFKQVR